MELSQNWRVFYLFNDVDSAANGADDDVVVVGQLGQLASLQHVLVELVVVNNWKDNLKRDILFLYSTHLKLTRKPSSIKEAVPLQ